VAKGADCKSAAVWLRRFESFFPHHSFQRLRLLLLSGLSRENRVGKHMGSTASGPVKPPDWRPSPLSNRRSLTRSNRPGFRPAICAWGICIGFRACTDADGYIRCRVFHSVRNIEVALPASDYRSRQQVIAFTVLISIEPRTARVLGCGCGRVRL
jgi:hypothetical protein